MNAEDIPALIVATAALMISALTFWRAQILARRQSRASLTADQVKWASSVIDAYGAIDRICFNPNGLAEDSRTLSEIIISFSTEIDKGRFLFPNKLTGRGAEKSPAYQGERQKILDLLMATHDSLREDLISSREKDALVIRRQLCVANRKDFVGSVQVLAGIRQRIQLAGAGAS